MRPSRLKTSLTCCAKASDPFGQRGGNAGADQRGYGVQVLRQELQPGNQPLGGAGLLIQLPDEHGTGVCQPGHGLPDRLRQLLP